ncbi:MAG TPA: PQQ-dependent sugar dehydrogenase [Nitrososphaeraceae archaeon]|nr:PQQ-dependent sugar dehydrogenase [Nitrososphaeraceae archaeon]
MNKSIIIILLSLSVTSFTFFTFGNNIYAQQQQTQQSLSGENITLYDPNLKLELVTAGLDFPTTMAFLDQDDFLILEKNTGNVKRVVNNTLIEKPVLNVNTITIKDERGLLGIAVSKKKNFYDDFYIEKRNLTYNVFLYYIECNDKKKNLDCENRIYRYELDNQKNELVNPKLLVGLPSFPDPSHIGGIIDIGPDENLYFTVGNFQDTIPSKVYKTKTQNVEDGEAVDGRAGILRMTQDGRLVENVNGSYNGILGNDYPLNLYYAYGIRNSFGIDFDPITGKLWDTENGPQFGDEINLVEPGFNSGADKIYGIWESNELGDRVKDKKGKYIIVGDNLEDLVYFDEKGRYSPPEFIWGKTVAPTALLFLDSDKLGAKYKNEMFVGSADGGRIFHFELNETRDGLVLKGNLTDKIALNNTEYGDILFAEGFSIITDVKQGPDGYLYIVSGLKQSKTEKFGAVFRIVPTELSNNSSSSNTKYDSIILHTQEKEKRDSIMNESTNNTNTNLTTTQSENVPKKGNTNVLSAIAPKLANTTKIIDTKAWDKLFMQ